MCASANDMLDRAVEFADRICAVEAPVATRGPGRECALRGHAMKLLNSLYAQRSSLDELTKSVMIWGARARKALENA